MTFIPRLCIVIGALILFTAGLGSPTIKAQSFSEQKIITTSAAGATSVHAADLDGDGDLDVVSASYSLDKDDGKIAWYENEGGGTFSDQKIIHSQTDLGVGNLVAADLTGDGEKDILYISVKKVAWHKNLGGGSFSGQKVITTDVLGGNTVYAADLTGNGAKDILSTSSILLDGIEGGPSINSEIAWYVNEGGGSFSEKKIVADQPFAQSVYATDLDEDGNKDIVASSSTTDGFGEGKVAWYENQGAGSFSEQKAITTKAEDAVSVYAADLTGSGSTDVLSASSDKIAWYENQGAGSFSEQKAITTKAEDAVSVYAADLTGSGSTDILSASGDKIAWYENQSSVGLQPPTSLQATAGDGQVDLTWNAGGNSDPAGYRVYRSTSSFSDVSNATEVATIPGGTSHSDEGLTNGTEYFYRVTAVDEEGNESDLSGQASAALQDLKLIGLEVNQSVQDWQNSVPLIKGKETIVRSFFRNENEGETQASVQLKGMRGGSPLPGSPLSPRNGERFEATQLPPNEIPSARSSLGESLNFELPEEWRHGSINLQLLGGGIDCAGSPSVDESCRLEVSFETAKAPEIKIFRVKWFDSNGVPHQPSRAKVDSLVNALRSLYPVDDIAFNTSELVFQNEAVPSLHLTNLRLSGIRALGSDPNVLYYGYLVDSGSGAFGYSGLSNDIPGAVASGFGITTAAHEIGHLLGLHHAVNAEDNGYNGFDQKLGYCGAKSNLLDDPSSIPDFPYSQPSAGGGEFATLGPSDQGRDEEIWGFNSAKPRNPEEKTSPIKIPDPRITGELMSYCDSEGGGRWVSDTTYTALRSAISDRFGQSSTERSTLASTSAEEDEQYKLVSGTITLSDDLLPEDVSFRSTKSFTATPTLANQITPEPGNYTLTALDGSGNTLDDISFVPGSSISESNPEKVIFSIPVQDTSALDRLEVSYDGEGGTGSVKRSTQVLGSIQSSQNPPTIAVQHPNGGENLSGDEVTLEWSADDPDGDSLSYTVQYSRNGGVTWKTLATSWQHDSLTAAQSALGATNDGLIRVQASDGFNTAQDPSDGTFSTSNATPRATIFSPSDGTVTDTTAFVTLEGSANDTEDGVLTGAALEWQVASGDSLGTGETLEVPASSLPLGTQTIELVATDSLRSSDTASVNIEVTLSNDPSLLASESGLVESDSLFSFGATGTNIDFAGTSGSATVTAELYDSNPVGTGGIPQNNISKYRVLIGAGNGLTVGQGTEVRFEADSLAGISDPTKVQIYRRSAPGNGPFNALDTQVDSMGTPGDLSDDVIYATVDGFGEFVLASDSQPLPVELSGFDATLDGSEAVRLTWSTASETNNAGFRVQRKADEKGESWNTVGWVEGAGTTSRSRSYQHVDKELPYEADQLTYRLKQVDKGAQNKDDDRADYSKEVVVERTIDQVELLGTYPNPAQSQATLRYAVPGQQDIKVYLYDILGRRVRTVVDGEREGRYKRQLDISRLASGVYFLRLQSEGETRTQKLTVVR
jgi:hypothetical protein